LHIVRVPAGGDFRGVPRVREIPGPYRFFFYSFDCREPKHIHAQREWMVCKFWLTPVALAANHGFSVHEMNVIRSYIEDYLPRLLEAWDEHCGS
jgi:hypothetical protein